MKLSVRRRLVLIAALAFVATLAPLQPTGGETPMTLSIEASEPLPGFHIAELTRYLALQMSASRLAEWRFEPATGGAAAANRVEWRFKLNPFAGGQVRGSGRSPMTERTFGAHRPITVEARLYLDGEYQTLVSGQATIQGGPDDRELAATVTSLTQSLLGASGAYRSSESGQRQGYPAR